MNTIFPIIISTILATFYVLLSLTGIDIYNTCEELKTSDKWKYIPDIMFYTRVIAMTVPGVLLMQYLVGEKIMGGIGILYGILGIIGSSLAYSFYSESECKERTTKNQGYYLIGAIVGSVITLIGSGIIISSNTRSTIL